MSRDIKYIGMDGHKEATVIAVLNGSGKLVMELIVETKASSILQFIHGLRGELHVTQVYAPRYRQEWLHKIEHPGVRRRADARVRGRVSIHSLGARVLPISTQSPR